MCYYSEENQKDVLSDTEYRGLTNFIPALLRIAHPIIFLHSTLYTVVLMFIAIYFMEISLFRTILRAVTLVQAISLPEHYRSILTLRSLYSAPGSLTRLPAASKNRPPKTICGNPVMILRKASALVR